ncbi:uncharacterized protein LOC119508493 isoform X2 [Choloepus didactylus]|uniref:uncharacterized protein LOC119508493 isoform X2 n=1 Tax=Choloepus didactylus TaxID=27675 RepID=UPI00189E8E3F|nr:uncharacterized protein LOC119508493 isoform X2 [Choloepus didactylus]
MLEEEGSNPSWAGMRAVAAAAAAASGTVAAGGKEGGTVAGHRALSRVCPAAPSPPGSCAAIAGRPCPARLPPPEGDPRQWPGHESWGHRRAGPRSGRVGTRLRRIGKILSRPTFSAILLVTDPRRCSRPAERILSRAAGWGGRRVPSGARRGSVNVRWRSIQ